ncbi:MAG: hypothetical protein A3D13_06390 [Planctomycetes bacterium RIFCSPHIGHO2_02_FULL_40_12]|nr:MAG: hypothetical protein A3D13_06390 [Planctomycetes bacterium RIFCSPHIGHO2_02_FULL_40_12]
MLEITKRVLKYQNLCHITPPQSLFTKAPLCVAKHKYQIWYQFSILKNSDTVERVLLADLTLTGFQNPVRVAKQMKNHVLQKTKLLPNLFRLPTVAETFLPDGMFGGQGSTFMISW